MGHLNKNCNFFCIQIEIMIFFKVHNYIQIVNGKLTLLFTLLCDLNLMFYVRSLYICISDIFDFKIYPFDIHLLFGSPIDRRMMV